MRGQQSSHWVGKQVQSSNNGLPGSNNRHHATQTLRRHLSLEQLEARHLLATDFGGIRGVIFNDVDNDGIVDQGESGLGGVQLLLTQNGNPVSTSTTSADGMYRFEGLTAGTYTLTQLAAPPGFQISSGQSPRSITISTAQAQGVAGTPIDNFDGTEQLVSATVLGPGSSSVADVGAIGGRRDLFARNLSQEDDVQFASNRLFSGQLQFNPFLTNRGSYLATWDGDTLATTDDPLTLNATGLGGLDLTNSGATTAFQLFGGIQGAGQTLTLRVYSDSDSFSEATVSFPNSATVDQEILIPFSSFVVAGQFGADFSNVGAVQLEHTATLDALDGGLDQVGTLGPNFTIANFANTRPAAPVVNDYGAIRGTIFDDRDNDGVLEAGEPGLGGVQVVLGRAGSPDRTTTTAVDGSYSFTRLMAGAYTLTQTAAPVGFVIGANQSPKTITISPQQAQGTLGTVIDRFDGVPQSVTATNGGVAADNVVDPDAIGGFRDLFVEVLDNPGSSDLNVNLSSNPLRLSFDPSNIARGQYLVTWDGDDNVTTDVPETLNRVGLNGRDLTNGGRATDVRLIAGIDGAGQTLVLRVYSDAQNFSTASIAIPNTGGPVTEAVTIPFTQFVASGGGGADFTSVGAIQLEYVATIVAADGGVDDLITLGPTFTTADFANLQTVDLSLSKSVADDTPDLGGNTTFTVMVSNPGPGSATGVVVTDLLPVGLTLITQTPSQGTYTASTGIWNVGTLGAGANATLTLLVSIDTLGTKINNALITDIDQVDSNTSNNSAMAMVTPRGLLAIQLVKATNGTAQNMATGGPRVLVGSTVVFSYTVSNSGNVPLANVTVTDDNGTPSVTTDDFVAMFRSGDSDNDQQLDLTETWIFEATRIATEGLHVNSGIARGLSDGQAVTATSVSNHTGFVPPLIEGVLYNDQNRNGTQDPGEPGLPGLTVFLDQDQDGVQGPTELAELTDAAGAYSFEDLADGAYRVTPILTRREGQTVPGGTFPGTITPVSTRSRINRSVTTADFDQDGDSDIIVAGEQRGIVTIVRNDAAGTFSAPLELELDARPQTVRAADFNGDGRVDLAVTVVGRSGASNAGEVVFFAGRSDETFEAPVRFSFGDGLLDMATGDFDGDGDVDLAVTSFRSGEVLLLVNDGRGNFLLGDRRSTGHQPVSVAAGDLDGDGDLDLLVANSASDNVVQLLNNDGELSAAMEVAAGLGPGYVTTGMWNNDEFVDAVIVFYGRAVAGGNFQSNDELRIISGTANGIGGETITIELPDNSGAEYVTLADLDLDRDLDLLLAASERSAIIQFVNDFGVPRRAADIAVAGGPEWLSVGNFNRDGNTDLVAAGGASGVSVSLRSVGVRTVTITSGQGFADQDFGLVPEGEQTTTFAASNSVGVGSFPHNPRDPRDTNDDGAVGPLDALLVINLLSRAANGVPAAANDAALAGIFPDVDNDGLVSPLDALLVINELSQPRAARSASGIGSTGETVPSSASRLPRADTATEHVEGLLPLQDPHGMRRLRGLRHGIRAPRK